MEKVARGSKSSVLEGVDSMKNDKIIGLYIIEDF